MFEFMAGVLIGGIFGVVCDRLWQRYEARICIDALIGFHINASGLSGTFIEIMNGGACPIPPCKLALRGKGGETGLGTIYLFNPPQGEEHKELLPTQRRQFSCPLDFRFSPVGLGPLFEQFKKHRDEKEIKLILTLTHSDSILWESSALGQSVLFSLCDAYEEGGLPKKSYYPMHDHYKSLSRRLKSLSSKCRRKEVGV